MATGFPEDRDGAARPRLFKRGLSAYLRIA